MLPLFVDDDDRALLQLLAEQERGARVRACCTKRVLGAWFMSAAETTWKLAVAPRYTVVCRWWGDSSASSGAGSGGSGWVHGAPNQLCAPWVPEWCPGWKYGSRLSSGDTPRRLVRVGRLRDGPSRYRTQENTWKLFINRKINKN